MLISLKRVIKGGWIAFSRNLGLNIATIFIMIMVIFLITFLFLFNIVSEILISNIQEKVDISVYFKKDVLPENILEIKSELAKIPEVRDTEYISKDEALEKFIERHRDNPVLMESLKEVGENPFLASLNIKAWQASQYEQIAKFLETSTFKDLIEKVDYYQRKPVIESVFSVTSAVNRGGILFSIILGAISVLVAINTIRVAISSFNEEIATMRLVGASNWFIRGPFLVQGTVAGIFATIITFLITFGICYGIDSKIRILAPEMSSLELFSNNLWKLLLIQAGAGIGLGIISSMIAIRKYLRI